MSRAGLRLAVACGLLAACAGQGPFGRLSPEERGEKLARDGVALQRIVSGLEDLMARARAKGLLDLPDDASTSVEQRGRFRLFFAALMSISPSRGLMFAPLCRIGPLPRLASPMAFLSTPG